MAVFQVNFMAQSLHRTVPAHIILPTDKVYAPGTPAREAGKPYKTLYLLHGLLGNYTDWLYGTRIQRWAEEKDLAVVMPSGDNAYYSDQPWNLNYYSEFIGKELVEFSRKTFPLSHRREDTFIGGLSMGGYGAIYNGLKYHDTFGCIAALSSAIKTDLWEKGGDNDNDFFAETPAYLQSCFGTDVKKAFEGDQNPFRLVERLQKEGIEIPRIYMACGEQDFLFDENVAFANFLKTHDIPVTFESGTGNHEWDFWDCYIKKVLDWLPLEESNSGISSGNIGK